MRRRAVNLNLSYNMAFCSYSSTLLSMFNFTLCKNTFLVRRRALCESFHKISLKSSLLFSEFLKSNSISLSIKFSIVIISSSERRIEFISLIRVQTDYVPYGVQRV